MIFRVLTWPMTALIRRELLRNLRTMRPFLGLVVLVFFASGLVVAQWPGATESLGRTGALTRELMGLLALTLLAALGLIVPAFGATSFVSEREERTEELLRLSLISTPGMVLGKFLSAVGLFVLLGLCCAPIFATLFFLVGLDWVTFAAILIVLLSTAASCAAVSLLWSAVARHVAVAVVGAYVLCACVFGAYLIPIVLADELFRLPLSSRLIEAVATVVSPPITVAEAILSTSTIRLDTTVAAGLFHLTITAVALSLACWVLRRPQAPEVPDSEEAHRPNTFRGFLRWAVKGPVRKPTPVLIPDGANPMHAREARYAALLRGPIRRRLFLGAFATAFLVSVALVLGVGLGDRDEAILIHIGFLMICVGGLCPAIAANLITKEYERGNLDMLRMTLLDPRGVVRGKARAGWRAARAVLFGLLFGSLPLLSIALGDEDLSATYFAGLVATAVCALTAFGLAMVASACAKRTVTALVMAYLLVAWFGFLVFPSGMMGSEVLRELGVLPGRTSADFQNLLVRTFLWCSPALGYFYKATQSDASRHLFCRAYWPANVLFFSLLSLVNVRLAGRIFAFRTEREWTRFRRAAKRAFQRPIPPQNEATEHGES